MERCFSWIPSPPTIFSLVAVVVVSFSVASVASFLPRSVDYFRFVVVAKMQGVCITFL